MTAINQVKPRTASRSRRLGTALTLVVAAAVATTATAYATQRDQADRRPADSPGEPVPVGNWNRIQTSRGGAQATSGTSRVKSDTPSVPVTLRSDPKARSTALDTLDDGTPVIMKCWINWDPPFEGATDRWFLVTQAPGAPHHGVSGFVLADYVWEQIRVPQCASGVDPALYCEGHVDGVPCTSPTSVNPDFLKHARLLLSGGDLTPDGFRYFDIRIEGFPAGWRADLTCLRAETTPWVNIGSVRLVADAKGNARNTSACRDGSGTYLLQMTRPYIATDASGEWLYSAAAQWSAPGTAVTKPVTGAPTPTTGHNHSNPAPPGTQAPPPPPKPVISNFTVVVYGDPGHVGVSYNVAWAAGRDPVTCHFFVDGREAFTAQCGTSSSKQFTGLSPGRHTFSATVSDRFGVFSDPSPTVARDVPGQPEPPPAAPTASLAKGPAAPSGFRYAITLDHFAPNTGVTITCHDSVDPNGFYTFTLTTDGSGHAFTQAYCYSGDHPNHWFRANGVESNHVSW
ncbi:hypothetical protein AB0H83_29495 [Dactylosporangium sp. NPDC050688]|uniref:hypothetical protein n=1 Tax=Dactylosporangium sp. NPDC050688 TaxID=3157217 RepID=UPI00340A6ACB